MEFFEALALLINYGVENNLLLTVGIIFGFGLLASYLYALATWRNI